MKRKNKIGTLFSVLLCMILIFSMTLFSACSDPAEESSASSASSEESTSGNNGTSEDPSGENSSEIGDSSNEGEGEGVDDEDEEPTTIEYRTQSASLQTVTEAAKAQEIASLTFKGTVAPGDHLLNYSATVEGKFNLSDQSGDVLESTIKHKLTTTTYSYNYAFLREGSIFTLFDATAKKSVWNEDVTLSYVGADGLLDSVTEMEGIDASTLATVEAYLPVILSGSSSYLNAGLLALANYTGAATEEENKVTVDLNKALYTLARDMRVLLTRVEDDTTVESFLKDSLVVEYMNNLMKDTSTDDLSGTRGILLSLLKSGMLNDYIGNADGEMDEEVISLLIQFLSIQPVKNSTTYEYLVDLLCSDELSALLTYIIQQQTSTAVELNIGEISINDLLDGLGTSKADLVAALKKVEENQFSFTVTTQNASYPVTLSDAKLIFNLNDDKTVASTDIDMTVKVSDVPIDVNATIGYSDEKATLTDISACTVSIPHGIYNDGTKTETLELTAGNDAVTAQPVFANNTLSSFVVTVGNDSVTSDYDAEAETLSFTYNGTEYSYTVKTQVITASDKETLLIEVYADVNNADAIYIEADSTEKLTYTVAEFLAAQKADAAATTEETTTVAQAA
jgi:hypothetical protein